MCCDSRGTIAIAMLAGVLACSRGSNGNATSNATSTPTPTSTSTSTPASTPTAADVDAGATYETAAPVGGKSVGHTSVVFKLSLEGGLTVAYKPRSTRGNGRYKGEIAAYRLARALGLPNVPLAMPRSFDYAALGRAVGRETVFAEVQKEDDGNVRGALMPWIKNLEFLPLENATWMPLWRGWLRRGGVVPDDQRRLASQVSTLLAFDLVTGNWDRWSGGNIGIDRAADDLLYVDNDGAFFDPPPVKEMKWPTTLFEGVDKFSRSFVAALRAVDVARAVGEEAPGEPLLSARVVSQTEARKKRVLEVIDAKVSKLGESAVLVFE